MGVKRTRCEAARNIKRELSNFQIAHALARRQQRDKRREDVVGHRYRESGAADRESTATGCEALHSSRRMPVLAAALSNVVVYSHPCAAPMRSIRQSAKSARLVSNRRTAFQTVSAVSTTNCLVRNTRSRIAITSGLRVSYNPQAPRQSRKERLQR